MKPIPQTIELAEELRRDEPEVDVLADLQDTADKVQAVVPDCIGLSVTWTDEGLSFTLVATDDEIAVLDAVQHLIGGAGPEPGDRGHGHRLQEDRALDEREWQVSAQATAARAVRSTLSLPLTADGEVVGSVTMYAASDHAFDGHHETLAAILGGAAADMVSNADLSFESRHDAEQSLAALRSHDDVHTAVGILVSVLRLDPDTAARRLLDASTRAGTTPEELARALIELFG